MYKDGERMMAWVDRIADIKSIPDADRIVAYHVSGWWVVGLKDEYRIGDLVIYVSIDSWVPTNIAPFLSRGNEPKEYQGIKGERLKTIKLKKQISQGLLLPMSVISTEVVEGDNVAELLGIVKYEPYVSPQLAGMSRGNFPHQVQKTDEERVQNLTKQWADLRNINYEVTEKLEGTSLTAGLLNGDFIVCSRNINLKDTEGNVYWEVVKQYRIEEQLRQLGVDNIFIQGEIIGEGIQGNHYKLPGRKLFVFSIYDAGTGTYLPPDERMSMMKMLTTLEHVPVVDTGFVPGDMTIDDILARSDGPSALNHKVLREGLVYKSVGSGEHWKAVSNAYLMKYD